MKMLQIRYNRSTYWALIGLLFVLLMLSTLIIGQPPRIAEIMLVVIAVPRLHDIGRSGWLAAVPIAIEIVGAVIAFETLSHDGFMTAIVVLNLVFAGLIIWLGSVPGESVANTFGPPPAPGIRWGKAKTAD